MQRVPGALSMRVKLITHLHLVLRSRMRGAIPPLPQYVYMACCLVKHRDNFTLPLKIFSTVKTILKIKLKLIPSFFYFLDYFLYSDVFLSFVY
jgi:hypothetical protein